MAATDDATPRHPLSSDTGSFAIVPEWLLNADGIGDRAMRLYAVLVRYADSDTRACWPSRQTLARRLDCSVDAVDRAMHQLVNTNIVEKTVRSRGPHGRATNLYVIHRVCPEGLAARWRPTDNGTNPAETDEVSRSGAAGLAADSRPRTRAGELEERARADQRPRDEVWDALARVWGDPATDAERRHRGKIVRDLKREGLVDAVQLERRGRRARKRWGEATPAVLLTRWSDLGSDVSADAAGLNWDRT